MYNTNGINPANGRPWADATGAFQPEAAAFAKLHGGVYRKIDNRQTATKMRGDVIQAIGECKPSVIALCCHGWRTGIQFGFRSGNAPELAEAIALYSGSMPTVALYCCSTGGGPGVGGDGGFADVLRDALCREGALQCHVDAHTTAGHCTRNPHVRRFEGLGSATGGAGGFYLVSPSSPLWKAWKLALSKTDLRLRFPLMGVAEIHGEIGGAP
jgi:hypothetical protein